MAMQTNPGKLDQTAARELQLYIDNEASLMGPRSQGESIRQSLLRKIKKGTFDLERSVDAWMYVVEAGAKKYAKEYSVGSDWHTMFSVPTRREVARDLAEEFYEEAKHGNYESNRSSPKPMSGYAYATHEHWQESSDEDWETEMFTPSGGETYVGVRRIDDAKVNVFRLPSGGYIAQLEHMTRNHKGLLNRNGRYAVDYMLPGSREQWTTVVDALDQDDAYAIARDRLYKLYPGASIQGTARRAIDTDEYAAAQHPVTRRNSGVPRPRPRVDTSLARVSRMERQQRSREKPFDPTARYPRETKPHHFSINPTDAPEHLRAVDVNGYRDPPEHNGQSVPYDTFENAHSREEGDDQWYEVEYAGGSDYSGSSVTKANFKELEGLLTEEHPEGNETPDQVVWVEAYGGHGTYAIFVRYAMLSDDVKRTLDALEDYPAIDDEAVSEEESEREEEAWENGYRRDFEKKFLQELNAEYPDEEEVDDWPEDVDSSTLFRVGMQISNTYWVHESGESVYIDLDRVVTSALELLTGEEPPPSWLSPDDWSAVLEAAKAFGLETK